MWCHKRFGKIFRISSQALGAVVFWGSAIAANAQTIVVPSLTVSEGYDSNVYNSAPIPGVNREDYVTTVLPQIRFLQRAKYLDTSFQGGAIVQTYVNNPGLNYVGGNGAVNLNLTPLIQKFDPRAQLIMSDNIFYSPQSPAFASALPDEPVNPFARGIQIVRVNTFTNTAFVSGAYALSPTTTFRANYGYSIIRFGHAFVGGGQGLLDTNSQTISAGPQIQLNPRDTINIYYLHTRSDFLSGVAPGSPSSYTTNGGTVGWGRLWSPSLRSNLFGGAQVFDQGNTSSGGGGGSSQGVAFNGGATVIYTEVVPGAVAGGFPGSSLFGPGGFGGGMVGGGGMMGGGGMIGAGGMTGGGVFGGGIPAPGGPRTIAYLNYSAGVYPSVFVSGTPLLSNVVTGSIMRRLPESIAVWAGGNYARNDSLSSGSGQNISFESYGANLGVSYMFMPTLFASLNGAYEHFKGNGLGPSTVAPGGLGQVASFDRYQVMLSLTGMYF